MNTLLDSIDQYIREHGIPFKDVWVSRKLFPSQFNKIVDDEMHKLNSKASVGNDYCLTYDDNGNLVLLVQAFKTRVLLADDTKEVKVDYPCTRMSFNRIFDKSCIYKYNLDEYNKFKDIIKHNSPSIDDETVEVIVGELIDTLNIKLNKELMKTDENIYSRDSNLLLDYVNSLNLITEYIGYLNNVYKSNFTSDVIVYVPNLENEIHTGKKNIIDKPKYEKKYSVISANDRIKVLESHPYMYACCSRKFEKDDLDNLCYLYSLGNNNYEIIIEPYNGDGMTRIIQIHNEDEFTYDDFKKYCVEYLEYPIAETRKSNSIAKLYHTTFDKFESGINYAITRNEKIQLNPYTKNNIDSLISDEKTKEMSLN